MWFKINLSGIIFQIKILEYSKSTKEKWDEEWCNIEIGYKSEKWLDYMSTSDEMLLSSEIEMILGVLSDLLCDKLEKTQEMIFIEPDFHLVFNPQKDLTKDPKYTYISPGYEIEDIDMEWKIFFWDEGLTDNYLSLRWYREDLEKLQKYLMLVTSQITDDDQDIQKMIMDEILYQTY